MSLFTRIVSKLRNIVSAVREEVGEIREKLEQRRAASLAEKLDELAKDTPYKNWRVSITDLAYVVAEDGSYDGRKELWSEFEMEGDYDGSAKQNIALHARLLAELPKHGIPFPAVKS